MIINVRENKKIIASFDVLLNNDDYLMNYPYEQGYYIITEKMSDICCDSCPICITSFKINDKITKWPECNHIYHTSCYQNLRKEHNIINCPMCRTKLQKINIDISKKYQYLFFDSYNEFTTKKIKYNEINPIYLDNNGNINIRHKLFCNKYNFNLTEHDIFEEKQLKSVSVIKLHRLKRKMRQNYLKK